MLDSYHRQQTIQIEFDQLSQTHQIITNQPRDVYADSLLVVVLAFVLVAAALPLILYLIDDQWEPIAISLVHVERIHEI